MRVSAVVKLQATPAAAWLLARRRPGGAWLTALGLVILSLGVVGGAVITAQYVVAACVVAVALYVLRILEPAAS